MKHFEKLIKLTFGLLLIFIAGILAPYNLIFGVTVSIIGGLIAGRSLAEILD